MKKELYKTPSKRRPQLETNNDIFNPISKGLNYILHGENNEETSHKRGFHALQIEQHHILLVLICICCFVIYWGFKGDFNLFKKAEKELLKEPTTVVAQPPVSQNDPLTWKVETSTPVNSQQIPTKLVQQMAALYPEVTPSTFRWFRTPKGWNAFYDAEKAKVKFSTEGYWLETEEKNFPLKDIPEYLLARVKMAYTSYTLVSCERETISSGHYYELTLRKNRPDNVNEEFVVYLDEKANNYANLYEGSEY